MSGDHNMYQKDKSYLDFECPRCGHCCKTDLARVGEVGVWGEWQGLTLEEREHLRDQYESSVSGFISAIEAKLKEKNHG